LAPKVWTMAEFVLLSLDPRIHSDLWFDGDRTLFWRALWRTPRRFFGKAGN
jgi:hypothetical protein